MFAQGSIASRDRCASRIALVAPSLSSRRNSMFFSTSVRPFSSADCSASTPLAAGRLPSALRSKEEIGVRMPPALPLHTVRARIICGFRLVSETGSGSSSSDLTSASGASQWGIHRAAIGLNAGALPVRRPRKSVTGSYRPPAYRCQSAQGRFWRCPCGQCAGYATQFVMKSITQRFNVACRTCMYAVR